MTTLLDMTKKKPPVPGSAEQQAAVEMVRRAREQGLSLTGPDGLLKQLTKTVLETALNEEMTEHLGHEKHGDPAGDNIRRRHPRENGEDRGHRARADRGAAGPGGHASAADRGRSGNAD